MAILFEPHKILKKIAPRKKIERLVTSKLTLNKAALASLADSGILSKKKLSDVTLKVIKNYRRTYGNERLEGATASEARETALAGKSLLLQRVQNAALYELAEEVKEKYRGEFYEWLPSDAEEPDPLHQLNYGLVFQLGKGEDPGDRQGCKCGMRILVSEEVLEL